jgi:DnaJ-class molecular chaperone
VSGFCTGDVPPEIDSPELPLYISWSVQREEQMGIEKMPSGRRMETSGEDETCPDCRGKGMTGDSPNNIRICTRCKGKGKVRAP